MKSWFSALFFLCTRSLFAILSGNPADPILMEKGIASNISCVSLRVGYFGDWTYKQRFQEEFPIAGEEFHSKNELSTYAGMVTLNFIKRLDLYTYLGSSRIEVDHQIFSKRAFAWCVGSKLIFLKHKNFFLGSDLKYFETEQKFRYLVIQGMPYNIVNNYRSTYFDIQASLGMAYKISLFVPYINATYIYSHISKGDIAFRFPDENVIESTRIPLLECRKRWGMALGFSLVDISKASLALEWRIFNQNALNVNGELRF